MDIETLLSHAIASACMGVSKKQVIRFLEEHNAEKAEIPMLIKSMAFKQEPDVIDYEYLYHRPVPKGVINHAPFGSRLKLYSLDNFLSPEVCRDLVGLIEQEKKRSTVADPNDSGLVGNYRTSSTANLSCIKHTAIDTVNNKLRDLLDLDMFLGEAIQGQKYKPGEYYKEHNDYFHPGTAEFKTYTEWMGQRTWTTMIYLNDVEEGGETYFKRLNCKFKPKEGTIVFWNNLYRDGRINPKTLHEALPPIKGDKYIITKWWRSWPLI
jgi:prolyl 4-hydroxylase